MYKFSVCAQNLKYLRNTGTYFEILNSKTKDNSGAISETKVMKD